MRHEDVRHGGGTRGMVRAEVKERHRQRAFQKQENHPWQQVSTENPHRNRLGGLTDKKLLLLTFQLCPVRPEAQEPDANTGGYRQKDTRCNLAYAQRRGGLQGLLPDAACQAGGAAGADGTKASIEGRLGTRYTLGGNIIIFVAPQNPSRKFIVQTRALDTGIEIRA